jgi:hypothetical protein
VKRCVECDRQLDKLGCANNRCIEYWRVVVERQGIGYRAEAEQLRTDLAAARAENAALVEAVGWAVSRLGLIADVAEKHDPNEHRLAIGACSAIANHLRAALAKVRP